MVTQWITIRTWMWNSFLLVSTCNSSFRNVALNKQAYQTDDYFNGADANAAVDGDTSQNWTPFGTCTATLTTDVSWEVDLGGPYIIDHVTIYNRQDDLPERLQEVELYVGVVREQYNLKAYQLGLAGSILTLHMDGLVIGRWVKITRRIPHDLLTLCEVQVFGLDMFSKFQSHEQHESIGSILRSLTTDSRLHCCYVCIITPACDGSQYNMVSGSCELKNSSSSLISEDVNNVFLELLPE